VVEHGLAQLTAGWVADVEELGPAVHRDREFLAG
jgi:hypothetical protein